MAASQETILGCPISSFLALETACSVTNIPACAAATSVNYDAACCGSITSYAYSLESCFAANAPACLDTAAAYSSLSGQSSVSNPCAAFAGAATTAAATLSSASSAAAAAGSSSTAAAAAGGSSTAAAGSTSTPAAGSSPSAASTPTPSATGKSDAPKVGAGLKVYIAVALVGALAVLAM